MALAQAHYRTATPAAPQLLQPPRRGATIQTAAIDNNNNDSSGRGRGSGTAAAARGAAAVEGAGSREQAQAQALRQAQEQQKVQAPHRIDQRPQTALLALRLAVAPLCRLLLCPCPHPLHQPVVPCPRCCLRFGLCARWRFGKPSYLATNRMKCRENRCTILPLPRPPLILLQHIYCVQIVCGAHSPLQLPLSLSHLPLATCAFVNDIWDTFTKTFYVFRSKSLRRCLPLPLLPDPCPLPANAVLVAD